MGSTGMRPGNGNGTGSALQSAQGTKGTLSAPSVRHRPTTILQFKEIARRLALGQTVRDIAANMGVQDQIVSQAYHDPEFQQILMNAEDKRDQEVYNVSGHMASVLKEACSTIVDIMSDPDALPSIRLGCAKEVIKQGLRQFGPPRIGSITQNNISYEERLQQYEQSNLGSISALAGDVPKDYYVPKDTESTYTPVTPESPINGWDDLDDDDAEFDVPVTDGGSFDLIARTLGMPPLSDTPDPCDAPECTEDSPRPHLTLLEQELNDSKLTKD